MSPTSIDDTIRSPGGTPAKAVKQNRLHIRQETINNAKGAVRTTMELLAIAAQMTQNVPYLGAVSAALTAFVKIQDEVDECKDECNAAFDDAKQMNALITKFRGRCEELGKGDSSLNETLGDAFTELEKIVMECVAVLEKCRVTSGRKRDRVRLYLRRSELAKSVKDCAVKMSKALQQFNTMLQIDQVFRLEYIQDKVDKMHIALQSSNAVQATTPAFSKTWSFRAAPAIFYGREEEVGHAVDLIVHQPPARVAILGPGGIGKTSIALTILHHPEVEAIYKDYRCFVSCEAFLTAAGVIRALAEAVGLRLNKEGSLESTQRNLLSYMKLAPGIVCLDNLETPWAADTAATEDLLVELASLPAIAIMITSRVTDTPVIEWTSPALNPIMPFSSDAALQTWDAICHGHDDHAVVLIQAVDHMPLAVTLLARLARSDSTETIWARWQTERAQLIRSHGVEHRLTSLRVSIELSLQSLNSQEAVDALNIICFLPNALNHSDISALDEALKGRLLFQRALSLLKQYSLVYAESFGSTSVSNVKIRVLSPIRDHMQQSYKISDELFLALGDAISDMGFESAHVYIKSGFERAPPCCRRSLEIIAFNPVQYLSDIESASRAAEMALRLKSPALSMAYARLGVLWIEQNEYATGRNFMSKALELHESHEDWVAVGACWTYIAYTYYAEFFEDYDSCHLDEAQEALENGWRICEERQISYEEQDFDPQTMQRWVNEQRRGMHMPIKYDDFYLTPDDYLSVLACRPTASDPARTVYYWTDLHSSSSPLPSILH